MRRSGAHHHPRESARTSWFDLSVQSSTAVMSIVSISVDMLESKRRPAPPLPPTPAAIRYAARWLAPSNDVGGGTRILGDPVASRISLTVHNFGRTNLTARCSPTVHTHRLPTRRLVRARAGVRNADTAHFSLRARGGDGHGGEEGSDEEELVDDLHCAELEAGSVSQSELVWCVEVGQDDCAWGLVLILSGHAADGGLSDIDWRPAPGRTCQRSC
ncbi:hypothetical protein C8Q77DRAFT_250655 [Trametes polyzona]|nr:hypothetical protein C8Q77DRAFT_250655 [Trametes polyzona]